MSTKTRASRLRTRASIGVAGAILIAVCARQVPAIARGASDFPDGYDAVTVAPNSHKVIFENTLVRVLEVTVPPPGKTEPITIAGLAFFCPGIPAENRRTSVITSRGALSGTRRATIVRFTRVDGQFNGCRRSRCTRSRLLRTTTPLMILHYCASR